ncbi:hypothetical protein ES703_35575 [subsurface metagenome]
MPEFAPGEVKTAIAPVTVQPSGLSCEAEVFLGPNELTKVATSGLIPFVSTGVSQGVRLPVPMPTVEGTYHVYIDVYAEGLLIAAYQALEDVIVQEAAITMAVPTGNLAPPTGLGWDWRLAEIACLLTNNTSVPITRSFRVIHGVGVPDISGRIWTLTGGWHEGPEWLDVTLIPGQSITVTSPREFIVPGVDPSVHGTSWNPPYFEISQSFNFQLEDDLGNRSPVLTLERLS